MSDMNRSFSGSMPEFYDRFLVPLQFGQFAEDLAERLRTMTSGQLLEIAAGTGIVTRALTGTLSKSVDITATDLNPQMLEQAKSYPGLDRVSWREADATMLPFPDKAFDQVVCQFGVMFFPDKRAGFREALRVLRSGGQFRFNVWGNMEGTVIQMAKEVVGEHLSRDPKTLGAPQYNDIKTISAELTTAGFTSITAEKVAKRSHSASALEAAIATCHGGLLRAEIEKYAPHRLDEITNAAAATIAARYGHGPIDAPLHAILFTGVRPTG